MRRIEFGRFCFVDGIKMTQFCFVNGIKTYQEVVVEPELELTRIEESMPFLAQF